MFGSKEGHDSAGNMQSCIVLLQRTVTEAAEIGTVTPAKYNGCCSNCRQCEQEVIETCIQWHPIPSLQVMCQYDDVECTLAVCVLHDAAKHECGHHDPVYRTWIRRKRRREAIPASRFVVHDTIGGAPVCDTASRVVDTIVAVLTVHAAANVVELFVQTQVVLQTIAFLDSGFVTSLYDSVRPC